ncbi:MAG: MATE family efflux transporter [Mycoplasmatales bacterium]
MKEKKTAKYLIEEAPVAKTIAILVIPALLGSVVAQINFILDTFFLSRVTYENVDILLAAVAAAFPLSLIIMAFANLFGIGGSIYGAKVLGQGDKVKARSVFSGTLVWGLIANVGLIIVLLIILQPLLSMLGATDPDTLKYAVDYAMPMIVGSFTVILTLIFVMFSRSEGKAMLVLITIVMQTLFNIILNYLFIIPMHMGTFGASLATVISQGSQFLVIGIFLFSKKSEFQFYARFKEKFNTKDLKEVLSLGVPATLGMVLLIVTSIILQIQAAAYNDISLVGAIGVLIKFFTMFTMLIQAAASGIQPVFAYAYGANNKQRFMVVYRAYFRVSLIVSGIVGILLIMFPQVFSIFLALTSTTAQYVNVGTIGLGIMLVFMAASFLLQVLYQSIGEAKKSMVIVLIRQLFVFLILTIIFNKLFGAIGIIISQQIAISLGAILTLIIYYPPLKATIQQKFNN